MVLSISLGTLISLEILDKFGLNIYHLVTRRFNDGVYDAPTHHIYHLYRTLHPTRPMRMFCKDDRCGCVS